MKKGRYDLGEEETVLRLVVVNPSAIIFLRERQQEIFWVDENGQFLWKDPLERSRSS